MKVILLLVLLVSFASSEIVAARLQTINASPPTLLIDCGEALVACFKEGKPLYSCFLTFNVCAYNHCPIKPCIDTGINCMKTAQTLSDYKTCATNFAECVKEHRCMKKIW